MSDYGSDFSNNEEPHQRFRPTDQLMGGIGTPNPTAISFYRTFRGSNGDEENLSLLGSDQYNDSSGSTYSDDSPEIASSSFLRSKTTYGSVQSSQEGITLTWRDLSVYVPLKKSWWKKSQSQKPFKRVLNNVSGAVRPGSLVALMGSSGAGKSTLMNALAQRTSGDIVVDGDILVNGFQVNCHMSQLAGYVHQDDLFVGSLTVREHLNFMARLRMDSRVSIEQRNRRVHELLKELGLTKARNSTIGIPGLHKCISGGEKKRLAFATEILTDPPLLFCDEPTTGLDSFNARKLVKMMKEMAARGKTILCTIHQPSSEVFSMFDKLLLLAEGKVAYMGSSAGALEFFDSLDHKCPATFNPADFYIHTLAVLPGHEIRSRDRIKRICNNFAVSAYAKDLEITIQHQDNVAGASLDSSNHEQPFATNLPKKPSWFIELYWLLWRAFADSYRNPAIHKIRIVQKLILALLIGLCYTNVQINQAGIQDIQGVLFIFLTENTFPAMYGVLNIFPNELPVFLREYKKGIYGADTYYISKMISLIPGFVIDPLVFCLVCYWMVGLQQHFYHFAMTVLVIIVVANISSACGVMFSAMFDSISYIMLFLVPFDVVLLISGGLFINITSLPSWISWVRYLSWFMYSNEALTVSQWSGVKNITCEMPPGVPCISTGEEVIEEYSFEKDRMALDFAIMASLYVGFHILGFIGLTLRARRK